MTHLSPAGEARMVDVSGKPVTARVATAEGFLQLRPAVVAALRDGTVPKGDALAVARIAGICAAKRVPDLIPMAHVVALHGVEVSLRVEDDGVRIAATARTVERTGVEMEALTAVAVTGLALHDMVKGVDPSSVLSDVRLLAKTGGQGGPWSRED